MKRLHPGSIVIISGKGNKMLKKIISILISLLIIASTVPVAFSYEANVLNQDSVTVICTNQTNSEASLLYDGITVSDIVKAYNMGAISKNSYIEYKFDELILFNEITINEFILDLKIDEILVECSDFEESEDEEGSTIDDSYKVLYQGKMSDNGILKVNFENMIMANSLRIKPLSYKDGKSGDIYFTEISVKDIQNIPSDDVSYDDKEEITEKPTNNYSYELSFLKQIGVIPNEANGTELLTRGEFATWLIKVLKTDSSGSVSTLSLKDVSETHPKYSDISYVFNMGYMSPKTAGKFMPDAPITLSEASEALFSVTGYKKIMSETGVEGFFLYHELTKNVNSSANGELTKNAASKLIVNAMELDVMERTYSGTLENYYIAEGKTLMKNVWKMSSQENIVTVTESATIIESYDKTAKGQVMIGNTLFDSSIPEIKDFIGKKIKFYYEYTEDMQRPVIRYFEERTSKTVNIQSDNIVSASSGRIIYTSDDMKEISLNINSNATILYNNKLKRYYDASIFAPVNGEITLIDNDGRGYQTVIIKEGIDVFVSNISDNKIIVKNESNLSSIDLKDETSYSISKNNMEISLNEIRPNNVLTIFPDKIEKLNGINVISKDATYYEIKVSDNAVKGTIKVLSSEYITIDETEYKPTEKFLASGVYSKKLGDSATYYLNIYGKIAASDSLTKSVKDVGYIYKLGKKVTDAYVNISIKVFTKSGHNEYKLAEKVSVNGGSKTELTETMFDNTLIVNGTLKPQLIKFSLNSDGLVDKIYTAVPRALNSDNSAELELSGEKKMRTYLKNGLTFNNDFLVNTNTIIFSVPSDTALTDENLFRIRKVTDLSTYSSYVTEAYDGGEFLTAPYVVMYESETRTPNEKNNTVVISKIVSAVNKDDAQTKKVYFYEKGKLIEKFVALDVLNTSAIINLRPGMVIQYNDNLLGEINGVNIIFDPMSPQTISPLDSYTYLQTLYGTVEALNNSSFLYRIKTNGTDEITKAFQFMGSNTYYYIFNTNSGTLFTASKNDIPVGDENSMVFMRFYQGQSREVVIYKNN